VRKSLSEAAESNFNDLFIPSTIICLVIAFAYILLDPDIVYAQTDLALYAGSSEFGERNLKTYTFIDNLQMFWNAGAYGLSILVVIATFTLPFLRLTILLFIWYFPLTNEIRHIILTLSETSMKFQYTFLFTSGLTKLSFDGSHDLIGGFSFIITSTPKPCTTYYLIIVTISCLLTNLFTYLHRRRNPRKNFTLEKAHYCERLFFGFCSAGIFALFFTLVYMNTPFVTVEATGLFEKTKDISSFEYISQSTHPMDPSWLKYVYQIFYYTTIIILPMLSMILSLLIIATPLQYFRIFPQIARLFELVQCYSLLEVQWLALVISALETDLLAENMLESVKACETLERYNFECWTMQGILGDGCWFYFIVFMIQILVCSYVKFFRLHTPEDDLVFAALNEVSQPHMLSPESDVKVSESTTSEPTWLI